MPEFNLYLLGRWFNQCLWDEPTIEEILHLFDHYSPDHPAEWIEPEFITMQKVTL